MSEAIGKARVLGVLETRYDYLSARNVFNRAVKESGIGDKDGFSVQELEQLCSAMEGFATHISPTTKKLRGLSGGAAPAKAPEPKKEAEKKPAEKAPEKKPAAEAKPAEDKKPAEEAKPAPEAKPAEEAKSDDKAADDNDKGDDKSDDKGKSRRGRGKRGKK